VFEPRNLRKRALESLRLAADCMQLARDAHCVALQSHFLRMAETWRALADQALSTDTTQRNSQKGSAGESAGSETTGRSGTVAGPVSELVNSFAKA
jgi:hypothetical protein